MSCCATTPETPLENTNLSSHINSLSALRQKLNEQSDRPLVFHYGDRTVAAGYHVTEVMNAQISGIDCGGNPESWAETVVQLLDVEAPSSTHMLASKFLAIIKRVTDRLDLDEAAALRFEVSKAHEPKQVFKLGSVDNQDSTIAVFLGNDAAQCKPAARQPKGLLEVQIQGSVPKNESKIACCGSVPSAGAACCT